MTIKNEKIKPVTEPVEKAKHPFSDATLEYMVANFGFGTEGDTKAAAKFVHDVLEFAPFYETWRELETFLGDYFYLTLYMFGNFDVIEHGGGIGGSWLDDKGKKMLEILDGIDWQQDAVLSGAPLAQVIDVKKYRPPAHEDFYDDMIEHELQERTNFCGCGQPDLAYRQLGQLLEIAPFNENAEAVRALVPNEAQLQFFKFYFRHIGLIDGTTGAITDVGVRVRDLAKEYQEREENDTE